MLGIRSVREMAEAESQALLSAQEKLIEYFAADHCFTASDVCMIHRTWLSTIYQWAGEVPDGQHEQKTDFILPQPRKYPG